jgi:septal ring factor EnvC (AmiA/AmiB activator)
MNTTAAPQHAAHLRNRRRHARALVAGAPAVGQPPAASPKRLSSAAALDLAETRERIVAHQRQIQQLEAEIEYLRRELVLLERRDEAIRLRSAALNAA